MHIKKIIKPILLLFLLWILNIGLGWLLIENNIVGHWYVFFNTVMASEEYQEQKRILKSSPDIDAPHVFYKDSSIYIKSVTEENDKLLAITDTLYKRDSVVINCQFKEHPEWNFSTRLKSKHDIERGIYSEVDSLLAISDIEGQFAAFRKLLISNKIIDNSYNWLFGKGHLVLVGDFFDRGAFVTETLWLIYHLERQAEKVGGKVHFILGNHEIMNMQDDTRYMNYKYYHNAILMKTPYNTWFKPGTELGNWLATKNTVEQIGSIIFVHGGISNEVNDLAIGVNNINTMGRPYYFTNKTKRDELYDETTTLLLRSQQSPIWYRGYLEEEATQNQVNKTLMLHNAETIVVGHSVVEKITPLYDNRIIAIDTRHAKGVSEGLFYTRGKYLVVDTSGKRKELF